MSKLIPSAAKFFAGNTIAKTAAPAVTTSTAKYSTKNEANFEIKPYKLHKLDKGPATAATLTSEDAIQLYERLAILRRIETASGNLYKEKIIRGFCHLYSGQEAVAVGMRAAMRDVDTVITAYRCHGWTYLMGVSVLGVLSELTGRRTGCSRGKGGSMHLYGRNFYGGNGIVGAQVPLGAGIAFAHKYRGDGGVNFALYGDGAANQGQLYEAYNMAKLWDLPCVFVCENNGYGMGTSVDRSSASTEYYSRGDYVPGIWVDGMDVLATREATRFAIDHCTSGKGPLLMEMETYRYSGHSMSDPGTSYRTRDEVQEVRQTRDPITSFKEKILSNELATPDQLKEIDAKVRQEVDEATKQAKAEPEVGVEELSGDIYYNPLQEDIRGLHPAAPLRHVQPYKLHKLDKGPATAATLTSEDAIQLYERLAILRRIETASGNLYKEKIIRGFCHLYSGQEAVAVGMRAAMRDVDTVITAYQCHGWTYLMGVSVLGVLSELTGRRTGCSRGKGGSMHLYGRNFYGGNGIVGAQVPLGAGIAFAHKYRGDGGVNFALYGDGAANQGQLYEAYNMAKLWDLPCVFVCENNGYGMGTSVDRSSASTEYYSRGDYVPGIWVDGMDVLATREATRFAIDHCTSGKGPLLMEMETYRYSGHSMSDPGTSYRTRDEVQEVRQTRDPITSFKEKILSNELATPDQLKEIDAKVRQEVDEATKQAKAEPEVGVEELSGDIYYNPLQEDIRGLHPAAPLRHVQVSARNYN